MLRILFFVVAFLIVDAPVVFSQVDVPRSLSKPFSKIPGTPRVVANEATGEWLVVWRQGSPGKILGRILSSNGAPKPLKTLLNGISSSSHSLDVAFDTRASKYLVAFESKRGLEVQLLDQDLSKQGTATFIASGVQEGYPRLVFDPKGNGFLLFWLDRQNSTASNILRVTLLEASGGVIRQPTTVATANQNNSFSSLGVARNPKNGRIMVLMSEVNANLEASIIGYMVKTDGSLLNRNATVFQGYTPSLETIPQASFADSGKGLAFWTDGNQAKVRKVSANGKAGSSTTTIARASVPFGIQPAISFDAQSDDLIALWAEQKQIKGARLNPGTGASKKQFDVAASSLDQTLHVAMAYNVASGNVLAVWEDAGLQVPPSKFRIVAGVLGSATETLISGVPHHFVPKVVTIRVGTTVKWTNNTGGHPITVTSGLPSDANAGSLFDRPLDAEQSFKYRFTTVGTFPYFCRNDPSMMRGTVIVNP